MISVVMTTYNGRKYISEQIDSILMQLDTEDELIISDNGSTDGTIQYLNQISAQDCRIRFTVYTDEKGVIANLNQALAQAEGNLIFLADQDDIWLEGRVAFNKNIFEQDETLLLLQTNVEIIEHEGNRTGITFFDLRNCGTGIFKNFWKNTWQGCNMVFRRSLLEIVLPIPRRIPMHDIWIGLLSELTGNVQMDQQVLGLYRRHDANQSGFRPASVSQVIFWRLQLIRALIGRSRQIARFARENRRKIHVDHV